MSQVIRKIFSKSEEIMTTTDSPWRGCASKFPQPVTSKDVQEAQSLHDKIYHVNCKHNQLHNIIYRTGEGEKDTLRHVFRWDLTPYDDIFQRGFEFCHKSRVHDKNFYSLYSYVQGSGRPLDSRKTSSFGFISTTVSNSWYPHIPSNNDGVPRTVEAYRYEIYAPGGIWTALTLGDKQGKKFRRLDEVAFVDGIAPQYIRSAQLFKLTGNLDGTTTIERVDNRLLINGNFNPQSHPLRLLDIENPVSNYTDDRTPLTQEIICQPLTSSHNKIIDWYARDVANRDIYLTAAFRSSQLNEAYYILQNLCTQLYYDPGGTHDHIVQGPISLSKMFKSLEHTPFGEHGIDASFQLEGDEAIIFSANLCALINYAPNTKDNEILKGPMTIVEMFPFLEGTVFENGIDEACELKSVDHEAYFFKENLCAHITYGIVPELIALGQISQFFPLLKGTIFDSLGVDAAYASHADNEVAYFFKFNTYGQINVNDDNGVEYLLGVWVMGANAPVIHSFVPQKNRSLDMRTNLGALPNSKDYSHDELDEEDLVSYCSLL